MKKQVLKETGQPVLFLRRKKLPRDISFPDPVHTRELVLNIHNKEDKDRRTQPLKQEKPMVWIT